MSGSITLGFDPDRVRALGRRTSQAIRALDAIRSSDPAAADAMRVVRLTRQNLADHWMPLIDEIASGTVMTRWSSHPLNALRSAGLQVTAWLTGDTAGVDRAVDDALRAVLGGLSDDEVLERLEELCESYVRAGTVVDPADVRWRSTLAAIAADLDRRLLGGNGTFREALIDAAARVPLIALAVGFTPALSALTVELAMAMAGADRAIADLRPGLFDEGLSGLLAAIAAMPERCLALLLDPSILRNLASWQTLEADAVRAVVVGGLYASVLEDPRRIVEGYEILSVLVTLANGPLENGFAPGLARGVADSLVGYIETLAPSVRHEGDTPVRVFGFEPGLEFEVELGSYDDVVDLFGAVLRDREAQAAVGVAVGAYADRIVRTLGDDIDDHVGVEYVARFADLVRDASTNEHAEAVLSAAADSAARQRIGGVVGFATGIVLGPATSFGGHVLRSTVQLAVESLGEVDPRAAPDHQHLDIAATVAERVTVGALAAVVLHPRRRTGPHLAAVTDEEWRDVAEHLGDIDAAGDDRAERSRRIDRMIRYIEHRIPPLAAHLRAVQMAPGFEEITEDRAPFDRDR